MKNIKKYLGYIIPAILCAAVVAVIFAGYFKYEYKANMAYGIGAPIGVSLCFICFCIAEFVCLYFKKFNAAIELSVIKFVLLFIGLTLVFRHTLLGMGFIMIFGLAIPIFLPVAIAAMAVRALFLVALVIFYIGIIAEPLLLAFSKKFAPKPVEAATVEN